MSLPGGYETAVREQGNNFSAGQKQRLAIARAILRDSPILILDEPTANLDVEAEAEVMHALNTLIVGRTVLTISHRLSTLGSVDEILVMQHGHIVERGTYQELKRKGGLFAGLLEEQNRYNLDRDGVDAVIDRSVIMATQPVLSTFLSPTVPVAASNMQSEHHKAVALSNNPVHSHQKNARILVEIEGEIVAEHWLNKPVFTIGRFPTSDIQIDSQRVSRFHALIRWKNGAWVIEDAESLNGLTYQGQRIDQLALVNGDCISIDPTIVLQYEEPGA